MHAAGPRCAEMAAEASEVVCDYVWGRGGWRLIPGMYFINDVSVCRYMHVEVGSILGDGFVFAFFFILGFGTVICLVRL